MSLKRLITQEDFNKLFNDKLFDSSIEKLLTLIATNPERYVGIFRATTPKAKLIQNLSQSLEIKFGDVTEQIIELFFKKSGYKIHNKKIHNQKNGKDFSIDQLFEDEQNSIIYFIEQKIRDDHDSTKKTGQFSNFTKKYEEISEKYKNSKKRIISIMWFIDDSMHKNKKYYLEEIKKEVPNNKDDEFHLVYGIELFEKIEFKVNFWKEYVDLLKSWKKDITELPELNLDFEPEKTLKELNKISSTDIRKLFSNEEITKTILPILFPTGESLKLYNEYNESINDERKLSNKLKIDNYLNILNLIKNFKGKYN